jgi:hypothetical protein
LASTPPTETFVREVDEELRRDQLMDFWARYGRWLVVGVVLILAAWGGWLYWKDQRTKAAALEGETYIQALKKLETGNVGAADGDLKKLKTSEFEGYRVSARLTEAAVAQGKGDGKGAAKLYAAIAADDSVPKPWRDLALVRQTAAEFDTLEPGTVIARLKPLAAKGEPWFGSAGEMVAIAYLNQNKPDAAGKLFADIGKDEQVPETIRSRAVQMAGALGIDAVNPAPKGPVSNDKE